MALVGPQSGACCARCRHPFQDMAVFKPRDVHLHAVRLAAAEWMFTTRIGIRQPVVERGICDIDINPAHADMPAHGLPVPAVIIRLVSSSLILFPFAPAVSPACGSLLFFFRQLNSADSHSSNFSYNDAHRERTTDAISHKRQSRRPQRCPCRRAANVAPDALPRRIALQRARRHWPRRFHHRHLLYFVACAFRAFTGFLFVAASSRCSYRSVSSSIECCAHAVVVFLSSALGMFVFAVDYNLFLDWFAPPAQNPFDSTALPLNGLDEQFRTGLRIHVLSRE